MPSVKSRLWTRWSEVQFLAGARDFSSLTRPDRLWGPSSLLFNGYRGSLPRGKVAMAWNWPFTSSYCQGWARAAVPLLPLFVSTAWTGPSLHFGPNPTWQQYNLKKIHKAAVTWNYLHNIRKHFKFICKCLVWPPRLTCTCHNDGLILPIVTAAHLIPLCLLPLSHIAATHTGQ
jgi:hypothetical protein